MSRAPARKTKSMPGNSGGKRSPGRASRYRAEFAGQALKLCRLGATDRELAEFFGVEVATLNRWKLKQRQFSEALKEGKSRADAEVADRLFKRACGYSHTDTKFATHEGKITDREEYEKHYPPDRLACIFWLKNRRPDLWSDKVGVEHSGPGGGPIQTEFDFRPSPEDEEVIRRIAETRDRLRKAGDGTRSAELGTRNEEADGTRNEETDGTGGGTRSGGEEDGTRKAELGTRSEEGDGARGGERVGILHTEVSYV